MTQPYPEYRCIKDIPNHMIFVGQVHRLQPKSLALFEDHFEPVETEKPKAKQKKQPSKKAED